MFWLAHWCLWQNLVVCLSNFSRNNPNTPRAWSVSIYVTIYLVSAVKCLAFFDILPVFCSFWKPLAYFRKSLLFLMYAGRWGIWFQLFPAHKFCPKRSPWVYHLLPNLLIRRFCIGVRFGQAYLRLHFSSLFSLVLENYSCTLQLLRLLRQDFCHYLEEH